VTAANSITKTAKVFISTTKYILENIFKKQHCLILISHKITLYLFIGGSKDDSERRAQ
jgi:hypothetical protein